MNLDGVLNFNLNFITGVHNVSSIKYADDTVLTAGTERKLLDLLDKVLRESEKKWLTINWKKT